MLVLLFVASALTAYAQIGEVEEEEGIIREGEGLEEGGIGEEEREVEVERDLPGFESALVLQASWLLPFFSGEDDIRIVLGYRNIFQSWKIITVFLKYTNATYIIY